MADHAAQQIFERSSNKNILRVWVQKIEVRIYKCMSNFILCTFCYHICLKCTIRDI